MHHFIETVFASVVSNTLLFQKEPFQGEKLVVDVRIDENTFLHTFSRIFYAAPKLRINSVLSMQKNIMYSNAKKSTFTKKN